MVLSAKILEAEERIGKLEVELGIIELRRQNEPWTVEGEVVDQFGNKKWIEPFLSCEDWRVSKCYECEYEGGPLNPRAGECTYHIGDLGYCPKFKKTVDMYW